jgi:predicted dehydrogenase
MSLWLVGAGTHAQEYAKVLVDQGIHFEVIGRSAFSAKNFKEMTGKPVFIGGLAHALRCRQAPEQAIVAVSFEELAATALALIHAGTKRILLEKPGGITESELSEVSQAARRNGVEVWIGYNRRYYASTQVVREMVIDDGGPLSFNFEFTEWSHLVAPMKMPSAVKNAWVLSNSSHVIDLAFHLCGHPSEWKSWQSGQLDWHKSAARYAGAGVTQTGVLFSYHADWEAPGRWSLEVLTRKKRYILRPMEQLHVTLIESNQVERVPIDDELDNRFKPGLYRQTDAFLNRDASNFCTIDEQCANSRFYSEIAGYSGI